MTSHHNFSEAQRFRQPWIILFILLLNGLVVLGIVLQIFLDMPFGNNPMPDLGLWILFGICSLLTLLLLTSTLTTKVDKHGITVQFFPFHRKPRVFPFEAITSWTVREYSPLWEYGGWGLRFNFNGDTCYNVSGNIGLEIKLQNGDKVMIGTQRGEELRELLEKRETKKGEN
jgi:hypothetical protein